MGPGAGIVSGVGSAPGATLGPLPGLVSGERSGAGLASGPPGPESGEESGTGLPSGPPVPASGAGSCTGPSPGPGTDPGPLSGEGSGPRPLSGDRVLPEEPGERLESGPGGTSIDGTNVPDPKAGGSVVPPPPTAPRKNVGEYVPCTGSYVISNTGIRDSGISVGASESISVGLRLGLADFKDVGPKVGADDSHTGGSYFVVFVTLVMFVMLTAALTPAPTVTDTVATTILVAAATPTAEAAAAEVAPAATEEAAAELACVLIACNTWTLLNLKTNEQKNFIYRSSQTHVHMYLHWRGT